MPSPMPLPLFHFILLHHHQLLPLLPHPSSSPHSTSAALRAATGVSNASTHSSDPRPPPPPAQLPLLFALATLRAQRALCGHSGEELPTRAAGGGDTLTHGGGTGTCARGEACSRGGEILGGRGRRVEAALKLFRRTGRVSDSCKAAAGGGRMGGQALMALQRVAWCNCCCRGSLPV